MKTHMKWIVSLAAALIATGSFPSQAAGGAQTEIASTMSWVSALDKNCPRCVSAKLERKNAPVPLPQRAVIYSFTGEFSHSVDWWLIDLGTGEIVKSESISDNAYKWNTTIRHLGMVNPSALENVRAAAAALWRSKPLDHITIVPGADEEDYVVSGRRLVAFNRFDQKDHGIVTAINSALPTDGAKTNGSFVITQPGH